VVGHPVVEEAAFQVAGEALAAAEAAALGERLSGDRLVRHPVLHSTA